MQHTCDEGGWSAVTAIMATAMAVLPPLSNAESFGSADLPAEWVAARKAAAQEWFLQKQEEQMRCGKHTYTLRLAQE
jgi:hypothetical protein